MARKRKRSVNPARKIKRIRANAQRAEQEREAQDRIVYHAIRTAPHHDDCDRVTAERRFFV